MPAGVQNAGIRAVVEGVDKYVADLKRMNSATDSLDSNNKQLAGSNASLGKSALATGAGFAVAELAIKGVGAAFKFGIGNAMSFEKGLDAVAAVSGATSKEMDGLSKTALRIGADTAFSSGQAVAAMETLAASGLTASDIMNGAADAAASLAAAGGVDLPQAADTVSTAMAVWGLSTDAMGDAVNRLAGAANVSRFGVQDMSQAIAMGGGAAAAAGIEFGDFTTTIAAIAPFFSSGSDAGTSLKTMLTRLSPQSKEAAAAMKELGIITADGSNKFFDAKGNVKSMAEITDILHNATVGLSEQQRVQALSTIFGIDAMRAAAGVARLTGDEFTAMDTKMKQADAAEIAKTRMSNLSGQMESLKGSLESVGIAIGTRVIPALTSVASEGIKLTNAFGVLPDTTQNIILLGGAFLGVAPLVMKAVGAMKSWIVVQEAGSAASLSGAAKFGLWTAAIVAATAAIDAVLKKATGHGLIETIFGDPALAEAHARNLKEIEDALYGIKDASEAMTILSGKMDAATQSFFDLNAEFERMRTQVAGPAGFAGMVKAGNDIKAVEDKVRELGKSMVDHQAGVGALNEQYQKLPPNLRAVFDEATGVIGKYAQLNQASEQAALKARLEDGARRESAKGIQEQSVAMGLLTTNATALTNYMASTWAPALQAVWAGANEDMQAKMKSISGAFPPVQVSAEGLRAYLRDKFGKDAVDTFDKFYKSVNDNFKGVTDAIASVLPATDETFTQWKARLDQMVADQSAFEGNLKTIYAAITSAGVKMPDQILAALASKGPAFVAQFTKMMASDPEAALRALAVVAPAIMGEAVDATVNRVIGGQAGMSAAFTATVVKPAAEALEEAKREGTLGAEEFARNLGEQLQGYVGYVETGAGVVGQAIPDRITKTLDSDTSVDASVKSLVQESTAAAVPDAASGGVELGKAVGTGVSSGVTLMQELANLAIQKFVGNLLGVAKAKAETGSPSKLFAREVGKPIALGVAKGVEDNASVAADAVAKLVDLTIEQWRSGIGQFRDATHDGLAGWREDLLTGLKLGADMSADEIQAMFGYLNQIIEKSGMPAAMKMEFEKLATVLMDGYRTTGSLSNEQMLQLFTNVQGVIASEGPKVREKMGELTTGVSDKIATGTADWQSKTAVALEEWTRLLTTNLEAGKSMSLDEIGSMFLKLNELIETSGMPAAQKMQLEQWATALMSGFQQTGSLANSSLVSLFGTLLTTIKNEGAKVKGALADATSPHTATGGDTAEHPGWNVIEPGSFLQGSGGTGLAPGQQGYAYQYIGGGQYAWRPYVEPVPDPKNPGGFMAGPAHGTAVPAEIAAIPGVPGLVIPAMAIGSPFIARTGPYLLHQGELVVPAKNNPFNAGSNFADGPGSRVAAAAGGAMGGSTATITIDMRGAQMTGTVAENESMMTRVVERVITQHLGRDALVAGARY